MGIDLNQTVTEERPVSLRDIAEAIEEFARSAKQTGQYPSGHPITAAAIARARQALLKLTGTTAEDGVRLTTSNLGLLFKGALLPAIGPGSAWMNEELRRRFVKILALHDDIEAFEVEALIELLTDESLESDDREGVKSWLAGRGVSHIEIEEQDYERLLRESEALLMQMAPEEKQSSVQELVKTCMAMLKGKIAEPPAETAGEPSGTKEGEAPDKISHRLSSLLGFLCSAPVKAGIAVSTSPQTEPPSTGWETYLEAEIAPSDLLAAGLAQLIQASFDSVGESPQARELWCKTLKRILWMLEPELRARLFRMPRMNAQSDEDALSWLADSLSPMELVEDIIFSYPMAITGENSAALGRLFRRLMPTPARRLEVEPALMYWYSKMGLSEENYRTIVGLLLDGIAKEQMMRDDRHGFHLRAAETEEAAPVFEEAIQDLLATLRPEVVERAHTEMLLGLLEFDYPLAEYANLCAQVARHAEAFQKEDKEQLALDLHKALIEEARSKKRSQSYRLVAASTLQRLGTPEYIEGFSQCIASCTALDEKIILVEMLALLGDNARSALLALIFQSQEQELVSAAAVAMCQQADLPSVPLDNISDDSLTNEGSFGRRERFSGFLGDALAKGAPEAVVRIFGILLKSHPQQAVQLARYVIRHPDLWTRLRIIQALGEAQAGGAEQALIAGLDDFAWEVRSEAARTLGKLVDNISLEAVPRVVLALCRAAEEPDLKARSLKVRLTALESLALYRDERALPTLEKILETKGLFFGRAREQLYGAAAAALAGTPAPRAGQLLELFSAEGRRAVAKVCKAALGNWQQKMGMMPR